MDELHLPFPLRRSGWWRAYVRLRRTLDSDASAAQVARAWARLSRALVGAGAASVAAAVAEALVSGEPPLGRLSPAARGEELPDGLRDLLARDLEALVEAAGFAARKDGTEGTAGLPRLDELAPPHPDAGVRALTAAVSDGDVETVMVLYLEASRTRGGGPAALQTALTWDGARLRPVAEPDLADWDALFGLDSQLRRLAANTEALLAGQPAHDALLYGARGSGKSTAVRGLLRRFAASELRLVEVRTGDLAGLPELLEGLRHKPQAFVLYVDDLSFDVDDPTYRPLKSLLEGGLAARPANVVLYATSNRRHLLGERFSDRPALEDDDVSSWDTQHERLALADRFGLVITFPDATQRRFLDLVRGLAERHGVLASADEESALRFAEWGNGYSGRTARQFVDTLRQSAGTSADGRARQPGG